MNERIERWASVYDDGVVITWCNRDDAETSGRPGRVKCVRLVEIRDEDEVYLKSHVDALTERAERAEVTVRARDAEIEVLRAFLKQFEDGGMSGNEVREAKSDERARFERETAAKLMCRIVETRTLKGGIGSVCEHMGPMTAANEARKLADIYFGAEEDAK